eukprot:1158883-Pelagomonas_calceolata.AAC.19
MVLILHLLETLPVNGQWEADSMSLFDRLFIPATVLICDPLNSSSKSSDGQQPLPEQLPRSDRKHSTLAGVAAGGKRLSSSSRVVEGVQSKLAPWTCSRWGASSTIVSQVCGLLEDLSRKTSLPEINFFMACGKHPFGETYERDSNILHNPPNLGPLSTMPEAYNLVRVTDIQDPVLGSSNLAAFPFCQGRTTC